MLVNRNELARRIAYRKGYNIGDVEELLEAYEDEVIYALQQGDEVKQGKLFKIQLQELPEKRAYNGLDKTYFTRPAKRVPKFKPLVRMTDIELPVEKDKED